MVEAGFLQCDAQLNNTDAYFLAGCVRTAQWFCRAGLDRLKSALAVALEESIDGLSAHAVGL